MQAPPAPPDEARAYTTAEVAALFRVDMKTVTRWDQQGRLPGGTVFRTAGGHRRFRASYIDALLAGGQQ